VRGANVQTVKVGRGIRAQQAFQPLLDELNYLFEKRGLENVESEIVSE